MIGSEVGGSGNHVLDGVQIGKWDIYIFLRGVGGWRGAMHRIRRIWHQGDAAYSQISSNSLVNDIALITRIGENLMLVLLMVVVYRCNPAASEDD